MNRLHSRVSSLQPRGTHIQNTQKRIHLNVGGEKHSPYVSTLKNVPDSPLAWIISEDCKGNLDYDPTTDVYFFDRHPGVFSQVLNYFQTGKLHCPRDVCGPMFQAELHFWGIDETQMEACCWPNYTKHREIQENLKLFRITRSNSITRPEEPAEKKKNSDIVSVINKWNRYQRIIWEALDEPYSSKGGKIFAYISIGFIVLSIVTYSLMTVDAIFPSCTTQDLYNGTATNNSTRNATSSKCITVYNHPLTVVGFFEIVLTIWFTMEIVIRFMFCPYKQTFMKQPSNWVDLMAVIPVYLLIFSSRTELIMILNMVRYVRIFRFFMLLYDLHILGKTLQASMNQLFILFLILCVPAVIFSSIVYYTEYYFGGEKSKIDFKDIPTSIWWSVITMTTVGYGRVTPESTPGRIFGALAALIGILILSMTTSVIGSSFQQYYNVARTQMKIPAKNRSMVLLNNKHTLLGLIRQNDKPASIQSDDSKDSGYGRSPIPPSLDTEHWNTPPAPRERNVIIKINQEDNDSQHPSVLI